MSDKSTCDRVFRSKTSMSNAILHNLESGSNELQSDFSENQLKLIEKADTTLPC